MSDKQKAIHMHWHSNIRTKAESCLDEFIWFSVYMLCAAPLSWGSCSYIGAWIRLQLVQFLWKLSQNTGAQVGAALGHRSAHAVGEEIIHTAHSNRTEHAKHSSVLFYNEEPDAYKSEHASFLSETTSCSHSLLWTTFYSVFWPIWHYHSNGQIMHNVISCISGDHAVLSIACFAGKVA